MLCYFKHSFGGKLVNSYGSLATASSRSYWSRFGGDTKGMTLVELVFVILVIGILSAIAIPRLFNLNAYQTRAAYDEVVGAVRYAQKLAVASGCQVQVVLTANNYALQQRNGGCNAGAFANIPATHPMSNGNFAPVVLAPAATFTFSAMGRSDTAVNVTVGNLAFRVIRETGYVDAP